MAQWLRIRLQCRRHRRCGFDPRVGKIPWRKAWQSTPVFLPGESHGERSLVGYRPRGRRELDATEHARMPVCSDAGTGDRDAKDGVGYKLI